MNDWTAVSGPVSRALRRIFLTGEESIRGRFEGGMTFPLLKFLRTHYGRHWEPFSGQKCIRLQNFAHINLNIFFRRGRYPRNACRNPPGASIQTPNSAWLASVPIVPVALDHTVFKWTKNSFRPKLTDSFYRIISSKTQTIKAKIVSYTITYSIYYSVLHARIRRNHGKSHVYGTRWSKKINHATTAMPTGRRRKKPETFFFHSLHRIHCTYWKHYYAERRTVEIIYLQN